MNKIMIGLYILIMLLSAGAPLSAQGADGVESGAGAADAGDPLVLSPADSAAGGEDGGNGAAGAGEPLVLSPAEAFERAYRYDLTQWQQSRGVELAEQKKRWRYLQLLPELEVQTVLASFEQVPLEWQSDISAGLSLTFNASRIADLQSAELDYAEVQTGLDAYRREFQAELYRGYYELLLLQEELGLQRKQLESARARLKAARYDFESGRISEYELLSARLSMQEQGPRLEAKQIEYRSALGRFKQDLEIPEEQSVELSGSLQNPPFEVPPAEDIMAGLAQTPAMEAQKVKIAQQKLNAKMVHTRFLPQLSLSLTRGAVNTFQGEGFTGYDSSRYALSLSFIFNDLLPGSGYNNARHSAETQLEAARRSMNESLQSRRFMVEETFSKLEKARRDIEAAELRLELAERFYEIAHTEYENGRRDLLEVEDAEIQRGEARLNLLRAYYSRIDILITLARYSVESVPELK